MVKGESGKKLYFNACRVLAVISRIVPKSNKKVFVFAGSNLSDSGLAVLEYGVEHHLTDRYKFICGVKKKQNFRLLPEICYVNPYWGIYHYLTSKYVFYSGECYAITPSKNQVVVNMAHGIPLKCFNKTAKNLDSYEYDFFTYLLAPSQQVMPLLRDCYGCSDEKMVINGFPRNDCLFSKRDVLPFLRIQPADCKKLFIWMPTYRVSRDNRLHDIADELITDTGLPIAEELGQLQLLNDWLEKNDSFLLIKIHPAQNMNYIHVNEFSRIRVLQNSDFNKADVRLYEVLARCDALITDYSSVYFDYLMLDRPICFTVSDLNSYGENRGFMLNPPEDYMPGPKINTFEGFISFLESCLSGDDSWSSERSRINSFANKYVGPDNCKRLLNYIGIE